MKINLHPHHQKHVQDIGIPEPPSELEVSAEEYEGAMKMWESTGFRGEDLRTKVAGHLAWKHHHKAKAITESKKPRNWEKWYLIVIGVLMIIVLLSVPAHCQFSKIKTISVTDGVTTLFTAAPFTITFSGCTVGGTGSAWTISCSGGPGGSGTVTSFSAGNLSPLFTSSVATPTTTPALAFSLSTAAAHAILGNNTAGSATPTYFVPAFTDISGTATDAQLANAYSGVGTPTACTNQFVVGFTLARNAAPVSTCTTDVLASAQHANQGTTTTVLHGNAAGNPAFGAVVQGDVTNGYVDLSTNQTVAGNKTLTGNTVATAGQNSINAFQSNTVIYVGTGAQYKYTTLETALAATECLTNGCRIVLVSGFTENVACTSTSISIGNGSTFRVLVEGQPNVTLTATGVGGAIPCFIIKDGSGMEGALVGASGSFPGRLGSFTLVDSRTGAVGPMVQSDTTEAAGQAFMNFRNVFVNGNFTSNTVTPALVDIEQLLNQSVFENVYVCCAQNTYLFRVTNGPFHEVGPIMLNNLWTNCQGIVGCKNVGLVTSAGTVSQSVLPVDIAGGNQSLPGPNMAAITVDGSLASAPIRAIKAIRIHTFIDDSINTLSPVIGIKLIDANGVDFSGTTMLTQNADTVVDISQSAAARSSSIHGCAVTQSSPGGSATLINNHVNGETFGGQTLSCYNWGGDGTLGAGLVSPYTVSGNNLNVTSSAGRVIHAITGAGYTNGVLVSSQTKTDAFGFFDFGCGLTAIQACRMRSLNFDGSAIWGFGHDTSRNFLLWDETNSNTRILFPQAASGVAASGILRFTSGETPIAWRNNAGSGDIAITKLTNDSVSFPSGVSTGASPPNCTPGTAGFHCMGEGTAPTNVASTGVIYPDSTAHEFMAATAGASTATPGMMVRVQPSPVNLTAQTAAKTTTTLCAASAGACNVAGQYRVSWNFWGSGTACSSVTAGSVTFLLTWTDANAVSHSAVALPMTAQTGAATTATQSTFPFQTALANESAGGDFTISTNGSVIQYATGYTACTTGTGTYNLRASVMRLQ